ncbi:hypothetical protein ACLOJK_006456 [Asimina triloba]
MRSRRIWIAVDRPWSPAMVDAGDDGHCRTNRGGRVCHRLLDLAAMVARFGVPPEIGCPLKIAAGVEAEVLIFIIGMNKLVGHRCF